MTGEITIKIKDTTKYAWKATFTWDKIIKFTCTIKMAYDIETTSKWDVNLWLEWHLYLPSRETRVNIC